MPRLDRRVAAGRAERSPDARAGVSFTLVLAVVSGFTFLFAAVWIVMVFVWAAPTPSQSSGMEALSHLAALGFGGLVGLVGGKLG